VAHPAIRVKQLIAIFLLLLPLQHGAATRVGPPRQVKVGSDQYTITYVSRFPEAGRLGETLYDSHTIQLLEGRSQQAEAETLMHELLHVMINVDGTERTMADHDFIYRVAPKLVRTLFADNPELEQYMLSASRYKQ
jgi:hypothetical protein